jgi:hypothetical protein
MSEEPEQPARKKRPRPPTPEEMEKERASGKRNGYVVFAVLCVIMPTLFIVNLVRDRNRQQESMGMMPSTVSSTTAATKVLDNEEELSVSPALSRPSPHDVAFSIGAVRADAKKCLTGGVQSVQVRWQVNPDGSASDVTLLADAGNQAFACVAAAVKQARVAPYDGAALQISYIFR